MYSYFIFQKGLREKFGEALSSVVPIRKKDAIMRSVMDQAGIKQEAQAVCFSLPVTDTAGIRLPKDDDE